MKLGGSFTPLTVIVNVWVALVSSPPFAVPPLSWRKTLTVADPFSLAAGVKVRVPAELIAGAAENRLLLLFETWNEAV